MGTVAVEQSGGSHRRSLDSEVNLIPMIDLFVCCIAFLLITAVWSHTSRIEARADEPGNGVRPSEPEKVLHVDMRNDQSFKLTWQVGSTVMSSTYVPKQVLQVGPESNVPRYPDLAKRIEEEWASQGNHRNANDRGLDHAVVHTGTTTSFEEIVAAIDAIYAPKRRVDGSTEPVAAFRVGFATD
ncbi:MAG: biopolymer transporter ExbD [Deltaproteobacteria bacterium]|nr:biopolymer transporter ExbD [Deltaproteobacteria bacterium]